MLLTRGGRKIGLMRHMAQVNRRFERRQVMNPAAAPFYLMTSAMGLFSIQLMGYILFYGPNPPVVPSLWSDTLLRALQYISFFLMGIYIGRMTHFGLELGNPKVVDGAQPELLDEKV
ncbi:hypothetical protein PHLGIDRAFT_29927 [Phlebiopsis gigantea 11061_1 CR5-6]|uniref:Uncharacterized protein n=1 Tax=Phlebiopsis gigantea (strain 11061_1 CR5-6) TaxID=745531 RepID=A0A0C3PM05_PHLG1|nr:hypothetical protein PHLGIDRAFT_29927 [Phlebiopsis gigantea 11061_1 CR5-6]